MKKILFLFCFLLLMSSCDGSKSDGVKAGETAIITQKCIVAYDETSYDKMSKLCSRKDEVGLEIMESMGHITILDQGVTGVVTDLDFEKVKIRLDNRREVWVATNNVCPLTTNYDKKE